MNHHNQRQHLNTAVMLPNKRHRQEDILALLEEGFAQPCFAETHLKSAEWKNTTAREIDMGSATGTAVKSTAKEKAAAGSSQKPCKGLPAKKYVL